MEQCTICGSSQLESLYQINAVPIYCNVLYDNSDSARNCCKGDIHLAYCTACEFIMNTAFDPGLIDYHQEYNNSLYCSAYFRKFVQQQITDLVDRYQLNNKKILEIGCGDGNYLTDLCLAGDNHGIGYDPSYLPQDKHQAHNQKIKFITDYYTADNSNPDADLICCRQTLEHIPNPLKFLKMLRNSLGEQSNTSLFFEVPNGLFTLQNAFIWDIIYEHCNYFTPNLLQLLFLKSGFEVTSVESVFDDQYITLNARSCDKQKKIIMNSNNNQNITPEKFKSSHKQLLRHWNETLDQFHNEKQRVVLWGMGSKGVTFLNTLSTQDKISAVIDINPNKQGKYIAGTGQQVIAPELLKRYQPDYIIAMNPIYLAEIQSNIKSMGINAKVITL